MNDDEIMCSRILLAALLLLTPLLRAGSLYAVGAWNKLLPPFPVLSVRAFGSWLAFMGGDEGTETRIEVAPGSFDDLRRGDQKGDPERRRNLMSGWRMSVEEELEVSGHSHSGKLLLLNPRTGIKFTIDTGEADSEIVYADEHTVIYRTNDVLFQSDLVGNKLIPAKRIVAGPPRCWRSLDVHWSRRKVKRRLPDRNASKSGINTILDCLNNDNHHGCV